MEGFLMKNQVITLILALLLITGCNKGNHDEQKKLNFSDEKSNKNFAEIYEFEDGIKIYSEFANIRFVVDNDEKISLKKALELKMITIDDIIKKMNYIDEANDGGSKLYNYNIEDNDLSDTSFMLVKCHIIIDANNFESVKYNTDIILGTSSDIVEKCGNKK